MFCVLSPGLCRVSKQIYVTSRLCCRGGWKGKPVVVLGRKEDVPMGLLPLVSIVARPLKHVRLVTALLKATALMRFKAQVRSLLKVLILYRALPQATRLSILLRWYGRKFPMQCPHMGSSPAFRDAMCCFLRMH